MAASERSRGLRGRFQRGWTDEQLAVAVAASGSCAAAIRSLGLGTSKYSYALVRERIAALDLDTAHWKTPRPAGTAPPKTPKPRRLDRVLGKGPVVAPRPDVIARGRRVASAVRAGTPIDELQISAVAVDVLLEDLAAAPTVAEWEVDRAARFGSPTKKSPRRPLTSRQAEALQAVARGASEAEAAAELGITTAGLQNLLGAARWSLDARTTVAAVAKAVQAMLIRGGSLPTYETRGWKANQNARRVKESPVGPAALRVLGVLADGYSDREIAARLGISPETVKVHVKSLLRGYGCRDRVCLILRVCRGDIDAETGSVLGAS